MSKIKVIIIAAVAAVIGYYGTTYFMGKHQIEIHQPVMDSDELDRIEEELKNEEIRGWWNESDVWRCIQICNRKGWA